MNPFQEGRVDVYTISTHITIVYVGLNCIWSNGSPLCTFCFPDLGLSVILSAHVVNQLSGKRAVCVNLSHLSFLFIPVTFCPFERCNRSSGTGWVPSDGNLRFSKLKNQPGDAVFRGKGFCFYCSFWGGFFFFFLAVPLGLRALLWVEKSQKRCCVTMVTD